MFAENQHNATAGYRTRSSISSSVQISLGNYALALNPNLIIMFWCIRRRTIFVVIFAVRSPCVSNYCQFRSVSMLQNGCCRICSIFGCHSLPWRCGPTHTAGGAMTFSIGSIILQSIDCFALLCPGFVLHSIVDLAKFIRQNRSHIFSCSCVFVLHARNFVTFAAIQQNLMLRVDLHVASILKADRALNIHIAHTHTTIEVKIFWRRRQKQQQQQQQTSTKTAENWIMEH